MTVRRLAVFILAVAACLTLAAGPAAAQDNPRVALHTSKGDVVLELFPDKAPKTVDNFLQYVRDGFYDGTVFHRVIDGFMIQGGGLDVDMFPKPTRDPILNEADNGLSNTAYTVAMARTPAPHSATSQFFINLTDNDFLDYRSRSAQGYGYAVFGRVVQGRDVVDAIAKVDTQRRGPHKNAPVEPVVIRTAELAASASESP
jgi:cyclophilin family peptidyl-prolyl cis-trans isomerase